MLANSVTLNNVIEVNHSGITVDLTTGHIGFPLFGLMKFFESEYKDKYDVSLTDGKVTVKEKVKLYGEGGKAFAKDLPFFTKAICNVPYLRNIGSAEGFCKNMIREAQTNHRYFRGITKDEMEIAYKISEGDYIVVNR